MKKIEEILEDYGLAKLMEEAENEERLSKEEALQYYKYQERIAHRKDIYSELAPVTKSAWDSSPTASSESPLS